MKKTLISFIIFGVMIQTSAADRQTGKLLVSIITKNKVSREKVYLNENAGKYKKLILATENNSVKVTRLKLEFDDGNEIVISQNFYVSRDDNHKEVMINRPGRMLVQITIYIVASEDKDERTVFKVYGI